MAAYLTSGLLCTVALSVLAYVTGRGVCLQQKRSNHFFFGIVLCSTVFLQVYLAGGIRWVAFIPLPDVLLWSSLAAPFLCFTAGAATRAAGLRSCLRSAVATCLVGLALGYTFFPLLRPALSPVRLSEKTLWADDVCLQSHTSTCAPAAAVTLLRRAGILAEERDLVRVCSTSDQGTESLGLYRGVRIYSDTPLHSVGIASPNTDVWLTRQQLPNVSIVRFGAVTNAFSGSQFLTRHDRHAVVVFGRNEAGDWLIGDPAIGKTIWSDKEFQARFTGEALYVAGPSKNFES